MVLAARTALVLLVATALVSCAAFLPPAVTEGGVQVSELALGKERIASGTARVFELWPDAGEIVAVTFEGAVWLAPEGHPSRSVPFVPEVIQNPVASAGPGRTSPPGWAAHYFEEGKLVIYGRDGVRVAEVDIADDYMQALRVIDLTDDPGAEIVIALSGEKYIEIRDATGRLLRSPRSPYYVTDMEVLRRPDGARGEVVVYVYPNEAGGGTFYFLDGRGTLLREWDYGVVSGFDMADGDAGPVVVTQLDGSYRILDLDGVELERLPAPLGDHFSDLECHPWRGGWIVVATGSGYHSYHMISVFDEEGDLIYQETGKGWARALAVPDPEAASFFVAVGSEVWRYDAR